MLRKARDLAPTFFKSESIITIFVDEIAKRGTGDNSSDSMLKAFHDEKDACMRAVITTFKFELDEDGKTLNAVFSLPKLNEFKIHLKSTTEIPQDEIQPDFIIAKCAGESILRKLYKSKLLENHTVSFTATRDLKVNYSLYTAKLLMIPTPPETGNIPKDTVFTVRADLVKRELTIVFGKLTPFLRGEIEQVFNSLTKPEKPGKTTVFSKKGK